MEIPRAIVGNSVVGPTISLQGEVDFRYAWVVTNAIQVASQLPGETIVLDMSELSFIDSSGISALVRGARALREKGCRLRLTRASRHIIQILRTAGFTRFFLFDQEDFWQPPPFRDSIPGGKMWQHTSFTVPARLALISYVRSKVSEMVESVPGAEEHLDSIRLAVGEAASNAVRHGCCGNEALKVCVECSTDGHTFMVEITDPGPGFDPDRVPTPITGELREGGMGIHFMRLTMDEVLYRFDDRGTTVRLMKRLLPGEGTLAFEAAWQPAGVP
jgi:serine/threonine-protein kinase RsbW